MKARNNIENITGIEEFNLGADIIPEIGAGGISFKNTLKDFESVITASLFENHHTKIKHEIDGKYIFITLCSLKREFEVEIDLLTGKIVSMSCNKRYTGKLFKEFGIGDKMSDLMSVKPNIGFDLDHDIYVNYPFDGLMIYPPIQLRDKIMNAVVQGESVPDFIIESFEIIDMEFARKHFEGTLIY